MIDGKTILAIIPARGGSKGVPGKNVRKIAGKSLVARTIAAGRDSKYIDRLILSSDDRDIIAEAKLYGCEVPFTRPVELARDDTPGIDPVFHALNILQGFDYVVLLQPTSPLRNASDIDGCIEKTIKQNINACVSVNEVNKNPYWMFKIDDGDYLQPVMDELVANRRQELPKVYAVNGAVYVANCGWLMTHKSFVTSETMAYIMPNERSIDIDTELDFVICEALIAKHEYMRSDCLE